MKVKDRIMAGVRKIYGFTSSPPGSFAFTPQPKSKPPAERSLTLYAGWLIDGNGGPVRRNVLLEVRNGLIQTIKEYMAFSPDAFSQKPKPDFDFSRCTLIPGLVDSHVHLTMTGSVDEGLRTRLREAPYEVVRQMIQDNLQEHLQHGVVAVRDAGGTRGNALRFAKSHSGRRQPVAVRAAGRAWHRQGRYGRLIGRPPAKELDLAESIRQDQEPADHIKVVNSGLNSLREFGRQTAPQFNLMELCAAVKAAADRGLSVMVHANGEAPVRIAAMAGCCSVEHGFFMGPENLTRLADRGITWVPTAVTMQAYAEYFQQTGTNPDVVVRTLDHQLEQLARARRLGVNVALGTDAGSLGVQHGAAVISEMKLLLQAGFSMAEAVRCASHNGAKLIGFACGLLAPGRPATFIAVEGEPSGLPDNLVEIQAVFIDGKRQTAAGHFR